ncbi:hypothetical protein [Candidatus Hepatobacter penaei]|uniref:hypothetical protein n=1 Tax=Candidatus Hepatobacter penaei TaxID=1274402 RepID=UPI0012E0BF2B|nr:hypothetical protein [Candidatus Hepatobacter penaei]
MWVIRLMLCFFLFGCALQASDDIGLDHLATLSHMVKAKDPSIRPMRCTIDSNQDMASKGQYRMTLGWASSSCFQKDAYGVYVLPPAERPLEQSPDPHHSAHALPHPLAPLKHLESLPIVSITIHDWERCYRHPSPPQPEATLCTLLAGVNTKDVGLLTLNYITHKTDTLQRLVDQFSSVVEHYGKPRNMKASDFD